MKINLTVFLFLVWSFHCYAQKQTGCILGDCKDGTGTRAFPDGGKYTGKWKDGLQQGMGVYTFPDGAKYAGEWVKGKQNGSGVYTSVDGDKYTGGWKNGQKNGRGLMVWSTRQKYLGGWRNDSISGHGKILWPYGGKYIGEWKADQINGPGTMTYRNGNKGTGVWKDGFLTKEMTNDEFSKTPGPAAAVDLNAQHILQQVAIGGGWGAATAYAGSRLVKTTSAWFLSASYYPASFININIERQAGKLQGDALNLRNPKKFTNDYAAHILSLSIKPGYILDYKLNGFANFVKNFYLETGYGMLNNNVTNTNIVDPQVTDHIKNSTGMIPFKAGYEINLLSRYYEPLLKIDFSYSFNYTIGKGLDGYTDNHIRHSYFYNLYAIGLKYAFSVRHGSR